MLRNPAVSELKLILKLPLCISIMNLGNRSPFKEITYKIYCETLELVLFLLCTHAIDIVDWTFFIFNISKTNSEDQNLQIWIFNRLGYISCQQRILL